MIVGRIYNELAADLSADDTTVQLALPRPGGAASRHSFRVDSEDISSKAWSSYSLANIVAGTFVEASASRRAVDGTQATRHKRGTPAWIRWSDESVHPDAITAITAATPNSSVLAIAPDGKGGAYIGGSFTTVTGADRRRIAHIFANGVLDTVFVAQSDATVYELHYDAARDILYAGGAFTTINSTTANSLAAIRGSDGLLLRDFNATGGTVYALDMSGDRMFVGGDFTSILGTARSYLVALDYDEALDAWSLNDWNPALNNNVSTAHVADGIAYFSGAFTSFDALTRNRGASVDASTLVTTDWNPNIAGGGVETVRKIGDWVYVGGTFTTVNGAAQLRISRVDPTYGSRDSSFASAGADGAVMNIRPFGSSYIVAVGAFSNINGSARDRAAVLNTINGAVHAWNPPAANSGESVEVINGRLWIGASSVNYLKMYTATYGHNPLGRYKFELELDAAPDNVVWKIYKNDALIHTSEPVIEFATFDDLVVVPGPQVDLAGEYHNYRVVAEINGDNQSVEYASIARYNPDAIYLIPIGMETGDPFSDADTFAAPALSELGNVYTLTLPDQTAAPTMTSDRYFYRLYAVLAGEATTGYNGGNRFTMTRSIGPVSDIVSMSFRNLYEAEISWDDQNAAFDLDLVFEDAIFAIDITAAIVNHPGDETDLVVPDQVQVERQVRIATVLTGPQTDRWVSDWQPVPVTYEFEYAAQGPAAFEYRYRSRYRDFRRDGIRDERGPIQVTSQWSAWSAWV